MDIDRLLDLRNHFGKQPSDKLIEMKDNGMIDYVANLDIFNQQGLKLSKDGHITYSAHPGRIGSSLLCDFFDLNIPETTFLLHLDNKSTKAITPKHMIGRIDNLLSGEEILI